MKVQQVALIQLIGMCCPSSRLFRIVLATPSVQWQKGLGFRPQGWGLQGSGS